MAASDEELLMPAWTPFTLPLGGIMALMPDGIAATWGGSNPKMGRKADYESFKDDASDYVSIKTLRGATVVVFSGDRTPTAWRIEGNGKLAIVRLLCWDDEAVALRFAETPPSAKPLERIDGVALEAGDYKFLDVARPINQQEHPESIAVTLQPSVYCIRTWLADPDSATSVIIHRIELTSATRDNRPAAIT